MTETGTGQPAGQPSASWIRRWILELKECWRVLPESAQQIGKSFLWYGIPAIVLSGLLLKLSGGVLWVPPEWRGTALVTGLGLGFTIFHLTRLQQDKLAPETATGDETAERNFKIRSRKRALVWHGIAIALICGAAFLRSECIHPWELDRDRAEALFWSASGSSSTPVGASSEHPDQVDHADASHDQGKSGPPDPSTIARPVYLQTDGTRYFGAVLFPVWFPWSEHTEELMESIRVTRDTSATGLRQYALDHHPLTLIKAMREHESFALAVTVAIFFALHLLTLAAASKAYAFAFAKANEFWDVIREG